MCRFPIRLPKYFESSFSVLLLQKQGPTFEVKVVVSKLKSGSTRSMVYGSRVKGFRGSGFRA